MTTTQAWLAAARPRTLPLALASILMGSFLAAATGQFSWSIAALTVLTTILLQILSNLANDYGDTQHGADSEHRLGPSRAVQSGQITPKAMRQAIGLFVGFALLSGLSLLWVALGDQWLIALAFLGLGLLSIVAAIKYTMGRNPYGYAGLGDLSVLLFFGIIGVGGTYYLQTRLLDWALALPCLTSGLFATAVLNINNIRDITSDRQAGKFSIPVRVGRGNAVRYHWSLLLGGLLAAVAYVLNQQPDLWQWSFLLAVPLLIQNGRAVQLRQSPAQLDPMLKHMALTALVFNLLFGIGQYLSS